MSFGSSLYCAVQAGQKTLLRVTTMPPQMRSGDGQDSSASFGLHMCAFVMFQASDVLKDGQAPCVGFQGHLLIE